MSKIIGITGGIASGKSTLVKKIKEAGFAVIDADQVVHSLQAKSGKLYETLLNFFGSEILREDGEIDRPKLSQMIFSSEEKMALSSHIQNQIIYEELLARKKAFEKKYPVFFMDIPLLIELNYQSWFDQVWLVYVDRKIQLERLMKRNHYSEKEASERLQKQMTLDEKRAYAQLIFDNNGSLDALERQLEKELEKLQKEQAQARS
ncbi:dephospho-CoA kinase [Streptococcus catagoni]|uniref:dephospho-CoA kinase n=1 Tax=Streptococcus catagoni TaxID=2654874 RepID=UPI00140AA2E2|nr:dephospho-CoA kinase [Streptococcus catagoni]